jgi:hypothetical protein
MSVIPQQVINPSVTDPQNVAEILVNGPVNLTVMGQFATMTFTTVRPNLNQAFKGQAKDYSAVVTARVTMPLEMLAQLRTLLNSNVQPLSAFPNTSMTQ